MTLPSSRPRSQNNSCSPLHGPLAPAIRAHDSSAGRSVVSPVYASDRLRSATRSPSSENREVSVAVACGTALAVLGRRRVLARALQQTQVPDGVHNQYRMRRAVDVGPGRAMVCDFLGRHSPRPRHELEHPRGRDRTCGVFWPRWWHLSPVGRCGRVALAQVRGPQTKKRRTGCLQPQTTPYVDKGTGETQATPPAQPGAQEVEGPGPGKGCSCVLGLTAASRAGLTLQEELVAPSTRRTNILAAVLRDTVRGRAHCCVDTQTLGRARSTHQEEEGIGTDQQKPGLVDNVQMDTTKGSATEARTPPPSHVTVARGECLVVLHHFPGSPKVGLGKATTAAAACRGVSVRIINGDVSATFPKCRTTSPVFRSRRGQISETSMGITRASGARPSGTVTPKMARPEIGRTSEGFRRTIEPNNSKPTLSATHSAAMVRTTRVGAKKRDHLCTNTVEKRRGPQGGSLSKRVVVASFGKHCRRPRCRSGDWVGFLSGLKSPERKRTCTCLSTKLLRSVRGALARRHCEQRPKRGQLLACTRKPWRRKISRKQTKGNLRRRTPTAESDSPPGPRLEHHLGGHRRVLEGNQDAA